MTPDFYERVTRVFLRACEMDSEERSTYLDHTCAGDAELRGEVDRMLLQGDRDLPIEAPGRLHRHLAMGSLDTDDSGAASRQLDRKPMQPSRIERYEIVREIGHGGMGTVYEARQEHPRRMVALKVIRAGMTSPATLRRFQFEAEVLGQLRHPGIAQIYESGRADSEQGSQPFFAMEYIDGRPLTEFVREQRLETRDRLVLFARICDAVHHAHQKGVIHRDLKPSNILVESSAEGVYRPKILDFGVARAFDSDIQTVSMQTNVGQLVGTVPYMSPEQVSGDPNELDTRSDVYALGVVCYRLLTGRLPYDVQGKPIPEAVRIVRDENPLSIQTANRAIRGDLATIVHKALQKDKQRRYQSAAEFGADVRRFLSDEPIVARPPTAVYQLRMFARRNRVLVGAAAIVLLALVGGIGVATWQARVAMDRAVAALEARREADFQRDTAQTEADRASAVVDFLVGMLEHVNPHRTAGRDVSILRELLDESAATIDAELADQPVVRATVHEIIGAIYIELGVLDKAARSVEFAYRTFEGEFGEDDPKTVSAMRRLAELRLAEHRLDEAEDLYRTLIEKLGRLEGAFARATLEARYGLAGVLNDQGKVDDAEAELAVILPAMREHLGEQHNATLEALNGLALLYSQRERYDESAPILQRVLEVWKRRLGRNHPTRLVVLKNLGASLNALGKFDEAEPLLKESLELEVQVYGEGHFRSVEAYINMAVFYYRQDRFEEAEEFCRAALTRAEESLAENHQARLKATTTLAMILRKLDKLDEASELYARSLQVIQETFGRHHERTLNATNSLAGLMIAQNRLDEAEQLCRDLVEVKRGMYGEEHPSTILSMNNLGGLLVQRGKADEAVGLHARVVEVAGQALPAGHPRIGVFRLAYGECLLALGRFEEAESELLGSHSLLEGIYGAENGHTVRARNYIRALYEEWEKPEQAAIWLEESESH